MSKKTCVFSLMRCNPVHIGHGYVFSKAIELQEKYDADIKIFLSSTLDVINNPLPLDLKIHYIKGFFPEIGEYIQDRTNVQLFDILKEIDSEYDNVIFVGGSDRKELQKILDDYNGIMYNFDNISTVQAGVPRDESSYSSSNVRDCVRRNDLSTFKSLLPGVNEVLKYQMFIDVQQRIRK